jgi:hypothetical protein
MDTKYIILNTAELYKVNFNEVLDTVVRVSVDGSKTFVKYTSNEMPASVINLSTKEGPYSNIEMLDILSTIEWDLDKQTSVSGSIQY